MESKNIHVLQTDKPSRLLRKEKELLLVEIPKSIHFWNTVSVNIYITNDDNIKEIRFIVIIQIQYIKIIKCLKVVAKNHTNNRLRLNQRWCTIYR
jgi:hypothetical protein